MRWWWLGLAGCSGGAELVLMPLDPDTTDGLNAVVTGEYSAVEWAWAVDGIDADLPDHSVPSGRTSRDEEWTVTAVVHDRGRRSELTTSVRIGNAPPTFDGVVVIPTLPTSTDPLTCSPSGWVDPDGDAPGYTFRWVVDGVLDAPTETLVGAAAGSRVACEATATDGTDEGPTHVSSEVEIANGRPTPPQVAIEPPDPVRGRDDLLCTWTEGTDPDGDPVDHQQEWLADGVPWSGGSGNTVDAWETLSAQAWTCRVTATDPGGDGESGEATVVPEIVDTNLLILVPDDLGNDKVGAYGEHPAPPPTPNIDQLAADGVLFRNFYVTHGCSPTRAALLTGRYNLRYGIGGIIDTWVDTVALPEEEVLLPRVLDHAPTFTWSSSALGKWHLNAKFDGAGSLHPLVEGFDWYGGSNDNLAQTWTGDVGSRDYFRWEKNTNGAMAITKTYATTDTVSDALTRIDAMEAQGGPWMLWVAFNAPHVPEHVPPDEMHTSSATPLSSDLEKIDAMIESLDWAIGDLFARMDKAVLADTTVVFLGDNGTSKLAVAPPWDPDEAKSTIYEAGVNVPLIVTGPLVTQPGTESAAFVHAVDLFDTVAAVAGVDLAAFDAAEGVATRDGVSFLPYLGDPDRPSRRDFNYTDKFLPNGPPPYTHYRRAVTDGRYKLHHHTTPTQDYFEFYDLDGTPVELDDLLLGPLDATQQAAHDALLVELTALEADLAYEY